jgi:hypothetical protein
MTLILLLAGWLHYMHHCEHQEIVRLYEVKEIVLTAGNTYENPYKEVDCWVELVGPGFNKKIYGFWNGENEFVFRLVATSPGTWSWKSYSNVNDEGINGKQGRHPPGDIP